MKVIGITGNIGMGKSTVGKFFRELEALVVDTDEIVNDLLNEGYVRQELLGLFGEEIISNSVINKKVIAEIVFNDSEKRQQLEKILHPLIFERIDGIKRENSDRKFLFIEAALIFECHYEDKFDYIINVFSRPDLAIQRLIKRGYKEQDAINRLNSQMPYRQKNELSDFIIENNSDENHLKEEVKKIYIQLERMANGNNK
ncbi:MAG TPA: dephospho-CoA kinase [Nitrospirae bacterium]|nr:dephospho-CoA kinase [Nitrospirota bacterium]